MDANRSLVLCAATVLLLAACARRPLAPAAPALPAPTGLRVTLTWAGSVDLDLYLTGPSWETVYFGNTPSKGGGKLEHDARCADIRTDTDAPQVESSTFAEPAAGSYRVGVDYLEACKGVREEPVPYRLIVEYGGMRYERVGVAHHHQFVPIVLEFALVQTTQDGPLTLSVSNEPEVK
ncbi:MAG TPA: hypothetical protein VL403_01115 [Candidatus Kryptonia bacterium]|nr:hypothetical protein [Candidatus Kryptonia bacterium]